MAGRLLAFDDVARLLDIVREDDDPDCAREALHAVVALPLSEAAAAQVVATLSRLERADDESRRTAQERLRAAREGQRSATRTARTVAGQASGEQAAVLAEEVRTRLLGDQFPGSLGALHALPAQQAREFLSALVALLLTAAQHSDSSVLRRAGGRMSTVVRALEAGRRAVTACLPYGSQLTTARERWAWAGALLTLAEPAEVLSAVMRRLNDDVSSNERRQILRQLASAAPKIGRPQLPMPEPHHRDEPLLRLYALLLPILAGPAPTRGRFTSAIGERTTPEETRQAYARLDAPSQVDPGAVFELRVGLAESLTAGVIQPPTGLQVPKGAFTLTVQLIADGFQMLGDRSLVRQIEVTPDDLFPYEMVRLRAIDDPTLSTARVITAVFLRGGAVLGTAWRTVNVGPGPAEEPPEAHPGGAWILTAGPRPDLEIIIAPANDAAGRRLSWYCRSPNESAEMNVEPVSWDMGDTVAADSRNLFRLVEDSRGRAGHRELVRGLGVRVGRSVPAQIWAALRAAGDASPVPTVLLGTRDDVPWELAISPRREDEPDFLGSLAVIGRWEYAQQVHSTRPPATIAAKSMALCSGKYESAALPQAEEEATALRGKYGAHPVAAEFHAILDCLRGRPPAEIVHFALHGQFDHQETDNGILLQDEQTYLSPLHVEGIGVDLRKEDQDTPVEMVFLNACQLGRTSSVFGEYAGMAPALVRLGVGAVVAPLWRVDDDVAHSVGTSFYQAVLGPDPVSPAAYLRAERASARGQEGAEGDRLAYVFYGHPLLAVQWGGERNDDG